MRRRAERLACWLAGALLCGSAVAESPEFDYLLHCQGCHLEDGSGAPEAGIPRFSGRIGYYLDVAEGRAYLAQVPGAANSPLSDGALAELLNWLLLRFGDGSVREGFTPYSADEVAGYRRVRPADIDALRRRLEAAIGTN